MNIIRVWGGLGNQMFQYALAMAFKKKGVPVKLDTYWYNRNDSHNGYELDTIFNASFPIYTHNRFLRKVLKLFFKRYRYKGASFDSSALSQKRKQLIGYWTSYRYFSDVENEIRSAFTFPPLKKRHNIDYLNKIKNTESVSVHVRRGDYVNNNRYEGVATTEYYRNAINVLQSEMSHLHFFFFSDDLEWCRNEFSQFNATFVSGNSGSSSFRDLQLMSSCRHNIIANSTFSWWAAWLNCNPDKKVIAPKGWYSTGDYEDLIPTDWIRL